MRLRSQATQYEEWLITGYECPIYGVREMLGEYESLDKLNYLAVLTDEFSLSDQEKLVVIMETSLDKGTQRKTTENELPSLTQCTA